MTQSITIMSSQQLFAGVATTTTAGVTHPPSRATAVTDCQHHSLPPVL